ncbi:MAG TPA: S8/S53 family peptidase [Candidatus Binatia bacterium]|nr:S8/S53 family peptidase [Candidatus Binatia bacterium]
MKNRRFPIFLIIILALVLIVLARCQRNTPAEFPEPERFEAQTLPPGSQLPEVVLRPGQHLVTGQIVVSGGANDIDRVLRDERGELVLGLRQVTTTTLDYLGEFPLPGDGGDIRQQTQGKRLRTSDPLTGRWQQLSNLRIDLYEFTEATPPLDKTLQQIAAIVESRQGDLEFGVVAEPNYVTGFEISGDPWGVEGSPWGVEGSSNAGSGTANTSYASDLFWTQWALQPLPGINLLAPGALPMARALESDGNGVQVAVFDSSPFDDEGGYQFVDWGPPEVNPLTLTVSHPVTLPISEFDSARPEEEKGRLADHGLFVSGLVYAVAPASDIHLIRILNDDGQGTLQAFIEALNIYMRERLGDQGSLQNTVINLSLGTAEPDNEELPQEARDAIESMLKSSGLTSIATGGTPVFSLEIPMIIANRYGATIVAASGNDSAEASVALPAQLPAAYPLVVGVEAGNKVPRRSCYSNEGDLLAPGGGGGSGERGEGTPESDGKGCLPTHMMCEKADCRYGVISYALKTTRGFAFWVGTSFATPLVSGLAADVIQGNTAFSPGDVQAALLCSAASSGVVDAVSALGGCP